MKKFVLTVLTVLTCGTLQALPAGNPAASSLYTNNFWFGDSSCDPCDPCSSWCDWFDVRLGFYGDYVCNRHLETKGSKGPLGIASGDVQKTAISTNAGLIIVDVCNWFEAYATIGVTDFHMKTGDNVWATNVGASAMTELAFSSEMSYSGGLRATIWECDCFMVGANAQYFYTNTSLDSLLFYWDGAQTYFNDDRSGSYQEWQVSLGASYIFRNCAGFMFVPYMNIECAGVSWDLDKIFTAATNSNATEHIQSLQEQKVVGWSLGMSAVLCDLIGVTVEGRWANEKAIHVNGQLSF